MSFHILSMSCLSITQFYGCCTTYELLMGSKINSTVYLTSNAYNKLLVFVIRLHWCPVYCGRTEECTRGSVGQWQQPAGKRRGLLTRGSVFCSADMVQLCLPLLPIYFSCPEAYLILCALISNNCWLSSSSDYKRYNASVTILICDRCQITFQSKSLCKLCGSNKKCPSFKYRLLKI